jgi:hypothetical protein
MKVFISHSGRDAELAKTLAEGLRREGLEPWVAEREILPGENWAERVSEALAQSEAMVALLTPNTAQTRSVQWEIDFALSNKSFRHRLIPVLVGTESEMPTSVMPWILERFRFVRVNTPGEIGRAVIEITSVLAATT